MKQAEKALAHTIEVTEKFVLRELKNESKITLKNVENITKEEKRKRGLKNVKYYHHGLIVHNLVRVCKQQYKRRVRR